MARTSRGQNTLEQPIVPDARGYVGEAKPGAYCPTAIRDSSQEQTAPVEGRQELANMAQKLLSGEEKWTNDVILDPKWEKILNKEGVEVKKDANEA